MHSFKERLKTHLSMNFPDEMPDNTNLWDRLFTKGIRQAQGYKLKTEYAITVFFNTILTLGVDFDTASQYLWVSKILKDEYVTEEEKVRRFIAAVEKELETE